MLTGLDVLRRERFSRLRGRTVALLCNQASIGADFQHALDCFLEARAKGLLEIAAVFGPQHGLWGHTQDNMVEWEGGTDPRTGLTVHSLYGRHREPPPGSLSDVDLFVVDIPDVGSRPYTFIWTMALCMRACATAGIPVLVLDRPNPLGGVRVEGPVLDLSLASFIGLYPLPMRHGMTVAEVARWIHARQHPGLSLEVVEMEGWEPAAYADENGLPWAPPSPNMPCPSTAVVFPGMCLLEGTNLSEGRGTTRPFETFGAPYLDGWALAGRLNELGLPGVHYRPIIFEPTFDKHAGITCGGCFVHVTDRDAFEPVLSGTAVLAETRRLYPDAFAWRQPPFEYDDTHMPIDILAGMDWVRAAVEEGWDMAAIRSRLSEGLEAFEPGRTAAMLYPRHG